MKRQLWVVVVSVALLGLVVWTLIYFSLENHQFGMQQYVYQKDSINQEFVTRKKELILKEHESLFTVFDRETVIVNNFRGWVITLLILCITALLTTDSANPKLIWRAGFLIILIFYILEVSERYVMFSLIQELKNYDSMFNISNTNEFNKAVINYEFRDLRSVGTTLKFKNLIMVMFDPKVIWWNIFLAFFYLFVIKNIRRK